MTWTEQAERFAKAAEKAKAAGNKEAFIDLIVAAKGCLAIAKQIERAERHLR
jgi:hypothetical protein